MKREVKKKKRRRDRGRKRKRSGKIVKRSMTNYIYIYIRWLEGEKFGNRHGRR